MSSQDPVAEWSARWQSGPNPYGFPPAKPPRSPWVYAAAAFGGTVLALVSCLVLSVGALVVIALRSDGYDRSPQSLTYLNDTDERVWVYECHDRCQYYQWAFGIEPDDQESYLIDWYKYYKVEWIVVTHEDLTYGCFHITSWVDQTLIISSAQPCPVDIHSPELELY